MGPLLPREHLERNHILQQILSHVDDYAEEFNKIDYPALKEEVLKPVIAETFNPETQIRGFFRTFRHTLAYEAVCSLKPCHGSLLLTCCSAKAIDKLASEELKSQIREFVDGKDARSVVDGKEFRVDLHKSPPVQHHFSLLGKLKKLFVCSIDLKAAISDIFHPKHKHVKNLPIIYEDANDTKPVEVSAPHSFSQGSPLHPSTAWFENYLALNCAFLLLPCLPFGVYY
jgi:hypothetical protein